MILRGEKNPLIITSPQKFTFGEIYVQNYFNFTLFQFVNNKNLI